jgi:D-alanyl-D-alanine carboxypeptidase
LLKRAFAALLIFAALPITALAASAPPAISAKSAVLIEAASGRVIYEYNADEPMQIASTTKILTALVVLEQCSPDDAVEVKREWTGIEGSSMYLKPGEKLTVRDLLYGMLLVSGNDAAVALACHASGSVEAFAERMNDRAEELGCENSSFVNPNGLDADGHLASARDLAIITAAAMRNKTFSTIVSTKYASVAGRSLKNHNKLLWNREGVLGVKTGYTKSAGRSLVSCAERDGMRFICVTLDDPDDWVDHDNLYDWAFESYRRVTIKKGEAIGVTLPVVSGTRASVRLTAGRDITFVCEKDAKYTFTPETPKFVYAAVVRGGYAGEAVLRVDGKPYARIPVFYGDTVRVSATEPLSSWEKIKRAWYLANEYGAYRGIGYYVYY